jgi:hypothetical protein
LTDIEHLFDHGGMSVPALVEVRRYGGEPPEVGPYPVLPALRGLLPGGLPRGQAMAVDGVGALPLALVAGTVAVQRSITASLDTSAWCAVVGLSELGMLAAADMGADLDRILLVDEPGERWPDVVATLLAAVEVVILRPSSRPSVGVIRRLMALARQHGASLIVIGSWEGAQLQLQVTSSLWTGLGDGHGHLRGRRVKVVADGRGAGARPRTAWLWLPAPDGTVRTADLEPVEGEADAAGPGPGVAGPDLGVAG